MQTEGRVVEVLTERAGDFLAGPQIIGDTVITLNDVSDFSEAGGQVIIDEVVYDYTTVDDVMDTMFLVTGLVTNLGQQGAAEDAPLVEGIAVDLYPIADEKLAMISQVDDGGEAVEFIEAVLDHSLKAMFEDQRWDVDDGPYVTIDDSLGRWYVIAVHGYVAQTLASTIVGLVPAEALTDGLAPAASPALTLTPTLGGFTVKAATVTNADQVTVDVYRSITTPVATVTPVATISNGGSFSTDALSYRTTYYFVAVARDADGDAPVGPEVSGRVLAPTDGIVPASSPTPAVVGGFGVMFITLPLVTNADSVGIRVYASAVTPVTKVVGNVIGVAPNGGTVSVAKVGGIALVAGTRYYVRTVAFDNDGDGPLSAESSDVVLDSQAGIFPIQATDIADGAIITPKLAANAVTALKVASDVMVTNDVFARDGVHIADGSGAAINLTPAAGYQQTDSAGVQRVNFPTIAAAPYFLDADLTVRSMTIMGLMSLRGPDNEISRASVVTLATGTTAPTAPTNIYQSWQPLAGEPPDSVTGSPHWDGTALWMLQVTGTVPRLVKMLNGVVTYQAITFPHVVDQYNMGGVTKIGTDWYVLAQESNAFPYVRRIYKFNSAFVYQSNFSVTPTSTGASHLGSAGTMLYILNNNYQAARQVLKYSTAGVLTSTTTLDIADNINIQMFSAGLFDYGLFRYLIVDSSGNGYSLNDIGVTQPSEAFAGPYGNGMTWNGSRLISYSQGLSVYGIVGALTQSSNRRADQAMVSAFTWYDSDAGGTGTHETTIGPTTSFTLKARNGIRFTTPPPADAGDPDNPNSSKLYLGLTAGTLKLEGSPFVSIIRFVDVDTATGVAPPATNSFPNGVAARIQSASNLSWFAGDDDVAFPVLENRVKNRANHTGTQLAGTISNFDAAVRTNSLDQMAAPAAAVSMGSQKITSLTDGTAAQDAVTKAQLDAVTKLVVSNTVALAGYGGSINLRRVGPMVFAAGQVNLLTGTAYPASFTNAQSIPVGFRPTELQTQSGATFTLGSGTTYQVQFSTTHALIRMTAANINAAYVSAAWQTSDAYPA